MCLLSVVIPVYKVEKYLHKCVDSIITAIKGNEHECEIVLVNDGSPDNCGKICDEYAAKYKFITVIHKENGGLSDARNSGVNLANGKFISFIDSDDYVNENYSLIFDLLRNNPECDFFKFPYIEEPSKKIKAENRHFVNEKQCINSKNIKKLIDIKNYRHSSIIRIVSRDFLLDKNIWFIKGRISEDYPWSLNLLLECKSMYVSNIAFYHYVKKREGSITTDYKLKNFIDVIILGNEVLNILTEKDLPKSIRNNYYNIITHETISNFIQVGKLSKSDKQRAINCLKLNKHLLKYPAGLKYKLFALSMRILGANLTLKLLSIVR